MTAVQATTSIADPSRGDEFESAEESALATVLHRAITQRVGHRVQDLNVAASNATVLVQGRVPTYYLKQLVIAAAMDFSMDKNVSVVFDLRVTSRFTADNDE